MDHEPWDTDQDAPAVNDGGLAQAPDSARVDELSARDAELIAYRERRARRIAELGLGSHLNAPPLLSRRRP